MNGERKPRKPPFRRHSLAGTRASSSHSRGREEGTRHPLLKFLMNRPWKQRSVSTPSIETAHQHHDSHHSTNEGAESSVRVVATVLQPHLYYNSVPVTMTTTVNDIIDNLVLKYAVVAEDKDPNSFYLMETHDRKQGSYSRVLSNSEEVGSILQRWGPDSGYFTLTRRPSTVRSEPLFYSTPSLFSSESSNLLAFVEEGSGSQLSQSLSDVSGNAPGNELSSSPRKQSGRHGNITSLVSPYSHGASRKGSSSEKTTSSLSRLQDTGIFSSSFSASFSRESTPISPTSPLIIESPSHQYIVTGSATSGGHHSDDSIHGNDSEGVQHFHFPSANPESPAETEGSHGNNTPVNKSHPSDVKNKMDVLLSIAGEGGGEGRSEEGVVTLESQRRKELSEKMKMSVERGLGEIMALIVEEGRPQVVGGEEEGGNEEEEGEGGKQEQTEMVLGEMRGREEEQEGEGREEEQEGEGREEEQEGEGREEEQEGEGREEEQEGEGREEEQEGEGREEGEEMEKEKEDEKERESMEEERERPVEAEEAEKEKEQENKEQVEIEETNEQKDEPMDEGRESITVVTLDSSPRPVATAIAASPTHQESSIVVSPVHKTTASVLFAPQPNRGEDGVKENEKVGEGKKKARETVKALEKVGDEQKEGGAWINLSDQFQSAMNIIDSFSATMEQDFGTGPAPSAATNRTPTSGIGMKSEKSSQIMSKTKPKATPYTPDNKKPEYLVSPNRRKKLVEQAAKRFPFKRAHTFDVGASHTPSPVGHTHPTKSHTPSSSPAQSRAKWAEQDLVSQTRKQRLMNDALAKMRHRFSQSTTAAKDTC